MDKEILYTKEHIIQLLEFYTEFLFDQEHEIYDKYIKCCLDKDLNTCEVIIRRRKDKKIGGENE